MTEPQIEGRMSAYSSKMQPLADRRGWACFIGTPKGHNAFYEIHEQAKASIEWYSLVLKGQRDRDHPRLRARGRTENHDGRSSGARV